MIERKLTGCYQDVIHKVKVSANNIGLFSFVSEEKMETCGDITMMFHICKVLTNVSH